MADLTVMHAKLARAQHHAEELGTEVKAYWDRVPLQVFMVEDQTAQMRRWVVGPVGEPTPMAIPLLFGDYVHALRSALDHLAWVMTSKQTPQTMFPIWGEANGVQVPTPAQFDGMIGATLGKVSKPVRAALRAAEPWFGGAGEMVRCVQYLDIVDKHRLIVPMALESAGVTFHFNSLVPMLADEELFGITIRPADRGPVVEGFELTNQPMDDPHDWQPKFVFDFGLAEPLPVTRKVLGEVLNELSGAVVKVIDSLRPLL
jgi:hypothetical protein